MKKILAAVLALTMFAGVAAPAFAAEADCNYRDLTLCGGVAKSLLDTSDDDE